MVLCGAWQLNAHQHFPVSLWPLPHCSCNLSFVLSSYIKSINSGKSISHLINWTIWATRYSSSCNKEPIELVVSVNGLSGLVSPVLCLIVTHLKKNTWPRLGQWQEQEKGEKHWSQGGNDPVWSSLMCLNTLTNIFLSFLFVCFAIFPISLKSLVLFL